MSRFRAGAARRSARLCCDEVDGSRVAGDRSSTRYRDHLSGQWPVIAIPEPDELLSSWLHRLAFGNGLPQGDVRTGARSGFRRLLRQTRSRAAGDRARSARPLHGPRFRSRRRHDARRGWRALAFVAVARRSFAGPAGRRQAAWLQFCPHCLAEDEQPYFRREWRLATTIACARHGSRLLDRCPDCGQGLAPFNQASLRPQNDCAACGFNLASAKAPRLGAGARRAAAILAALGRRVTDADAAVVDAILALPAKLDSLRAAALTALPTSERARALPALARDIDRLSAAATNGGASRDRSAERMPAAPQASLPALLEAYATVRRRRAAASQGSAQFGRPRHDRGLRPA